MCLSRHQSVLPLVLIAFLGSCTSGSHESAGTNYSVQDSAGFIVAEVPGLGDVNVPEWRVELVFSSDDAGLQLEYVRDSHFLPDASLLIADAGAARILKLDRNGRVLRATGRQGEGPGEFGDLIWLGSGPAGSFWAFDLDLVRLTRFDEGLSLLETVQVMIPGVVAALQPLLVLPDARLFAIPFEGRRAVVPGPFRAEVPLLLLDPRAARVDTIDSWQGLEQDASQVSGRLFPIPVGFGKRFLGAGGGGKVAVGSTDSLDVTLLSAAGNMLMRVVGTEGARPLPDDAGRGWRTLLLDGAPENFPDIRRAWREAPIAKTRPAFDGLAVDGDGSLWIGESLLPTDTLQTWVIFRPDGRSEAKVRLPARFEPRPNAARTLLDVAPDRVAVLVRGPQDEQIVEVWHIIRGS